MQTRKKPGAVLRSAASPDGKRSGCSAESEVVRTVVQKYGGQKRAVIQILQDLQRRFRWLAPETLEAVARQMDVPPAHVFSVATFYKSFSLEPRGRHLCTVCMGTACHVRGGADILEHFERRLGIRAGETSPDQEFTLERVNCLGACALAPLAVVDGRYYSQMNGAKADKVLEALPARRPAGAAAGDGKEE